MEYWFAYHIALLLAKLQADSGFDFVLGNFGENRMDHSKHLGAKKLSSVLILRCQKCGVKTTSACFALSFLLGFMSGLVRTHTWRNPMAIADSFPGKEVKTVFNCFFFDILATSSCWTKITVGGRCRERVVENVPCVLDLWM